MVAPTGGGIRGAVACWGERGRPVVASTGMERRGFTREVSRRRGLVLCGGGYTCASQQKTPKRFWRGGAGECLFLKKAPPHNLGEHGRCRVFALNRCRGDQWSPVFRLCMAATARRSRICGRPVVAPTGGAFGDAAVLRSGRAPACLPVSRRRGYGRRRGRSRCGGETGG